MKNLLTTFTKHFLVVFAFLLVGINTVNAQTQLTRAVAWLWSTEASPTAPITPNTFYSYNPSGGKITLTKLATGLYDIVFEGLNMKTSVSGLQVSAYGGKHHCTNFAHANNTSGYRWQIRCFGTDGVNKDGLFTAVLFEDDRVGASWDNMNVGYIPSLTNITTTPAQFYNSKGLGVTVSKYEPGLYRVEIKGVTRYDGSVMATGFDQTNPRYCMPDSWAPSGTGDLYVFVRCFDNTGKLADPVAVMVSYRRDLFLGATLNSPKFHNAFAVVDVRSTTISILYGKNTASTTPMTVSRVSIGTYTVNIPKMPPAGSSTVLVNGLTMVDSRVYCNTSSFASDGNGGTNVGVQCYNPGGQPADSAFSVQYLTNVANGTLVANESSVVPTGFTLSKTYPNPFNSSTFFTLNLIKSQQVQIKVFNMMGQHVATLHKGTLEANTKHTFSFDAKGLTSGTYFIQAIGADFSETRMATLLK